MYGGFYNHRHLNQNPYLQHWNRLIFGKCRKSENLAQQFGVASSGRVDRQKTERVNHNRDLNLSNRKETLKSG